MIVNFGWAEKADLSLAQTSREAARNKKKDVYISVDISAQESHGHYSGKDNCFFNLYEVNRGILYVHDQKQATFTMHSGF